MTIKPFKRSVPLKDRKINIVYFLDSAKSRSFQISLRSAAILGFFWVAFPVLAIIGMLGSSDRALKIQLLSSQNRDLRKSLFEYQKRYEGAYAAAYPDSEGASGGSAVNTAIASENLPTEKQKKSQEMAASGLNFASESANNPNLSSIASNPEIQNGEGAKEAQSPHSKKDTASPLTLSAKKLNSGQKSGQASGAIEDTAARKDSPRWPSADTTMASKNSGVNESVGDSQELTSDKKTPSFPQISNARLEQKDGTYLVNFELRSLPANTPLSGHLWLVGEFENDGKKIFYTSPKNVEVDASGVIKLTGAGERYRVRNFTAKFMRLHVGSAKKMELRKMTIGISDESGNRSSYPIDLQAVSGEMGQLSKGG